MALVGVVAVAEDALPVEVRPVVLQLVLDMLEVRVELIPLVLRRVVQVAVSAIGHDVSFVEGKGL